MKNETLILNGVKAQAQDLGNSDCLLNIGGADGSMIKGKVWMRVYTKQQFALVSKAFPKLGYKVDTDHVEFHSDYINKPEIKDGLLI